MKFVHVEDYFDPDAGYQINELITTPRPKNIELYLITSYDMRPFHKTYDNSRDENFEIKYNVKVIRLRHFIKVSSRLMFVNLNKTLKEISPDVVYFHGIGDFKDLYLFRKNKFIIYRDCHMSWVASRNILAPIYFKFYKMFFSRKINSSEIYNKVFFLGVEEKEYLLRLGISEEKIFPLLHGFNSEKMYYSENERLILRSKWGIDNNTIVIGYVGKFDEYKSPHLIFDIIRKIDKQNLDRISLVFIGSKNNKYIHYFNRQLQAFQNEQNILIQIFDSVPFLELFKVYSAIDICIFPKQTTLSSIHAQVCGCEVVMENEKSNMERVRKSKNLFNKNDYLDAGSIVNGLIYNWNYVRDLCDIEFFSQRDYKIQVESLYKL